MSRIELGRIFGNKQNCIDIGDLNVPSTSHGTRQETAIK
ncbi:hypothetical protein NPIL_434251, partial [Nephila pilipes]